MTRRTLTRRSWLGTLGTGTVVGLAGCTGILNDGGESANTYLGAKGWEADPDVLPFPTHGEELPTATLPLGLSDGSCTIPDDYAGRDFLVTFVYTHCMTMCPRLTAILAGVQDHAIDDGYVEEVAFAEVTFDPARDDAERFREWAEQHRVDLDAGTWEFLRPESKARAKSVVQDTYGVTFRKTRPEDADAYMFSHSGVVILVNRDGYVERTYKLSAGGDDVVTRKTVQEDLATLRDREA
jgi:protein SCO1/2